MLGGQQEVLSPPCLRITLLSQEGITQSVEASTKDNHVIPPPSAPYS